MRSDCEILGRSFFLNRGNQYAMILTPFTVTLYMLAIFFPMAYKLYEFSLNIHCELPVRGNFSHVVCIEIKETFVFQFPSKTYITIDKKNSNNLRILE
jgi:hypothetical protein